MRRLFTSITASALLGTLPTARAQHHCVTEATPEQVQYLTMDIPERTDFLSLNKNIGIITWLPIAFHLVHPTNGNGGFQEYQIPGFLNNLNALFLPANIQFYQCGTTNEIHLDALYDFNGTDEGPLCDPHMVPNRINLFITNTIMLNGHSAFGFAHLPGGPDRILLRTSTTFGAGYSTVGHEFGHYFGLLHTWGLAEFGVTDELVNGTNCHTAGDRICDTPADPRYSSYVPNMCLSTNWPLDPNGQAYQPLPQLANNYMANCRSYPGSFTPGQLSRMAYTAFYDRNNLTCPDNGSLCHAEVHTYPYTQGFESTPHDWKDNPAGYSIFTQATGPTPTVGTGPDAAAEGQYYVYAEGDTWPSYAALLNGPCFDVSRLEHPVFKFKYHQSGTGCANSALYVIADRSMGTEPSYMQVAPGFPTIGDQGPGWHQGSYDLTPLKNYYFQLAVGGQSTSADCDLAFDDFVVEDVGCPGPGLMIAPLMPITCYGQNDGQLLAVPLGGSGNYSYLWSNGSTTALAQNLGTGWHSVRVTDNTTGCSTSRMRLLMEPERLELSWVVVQAAGPGQATGSIDLTPSGGVPYNGHNGIDDYVYSWSNGATTQDVSGLLPGVYTVTITDQWGCSTTATIVVYAAQSCTPQVTVFPDVQEFTQNLGLWQQATNDNFNWTRTSTFFTTPVNTGPEVASASGNTHYLTARSTNSGTSPRTASLISPCLDLTLVEHPHLQFLSHMYGDQMGTLSVSISTDGGSTWSAPIWQVSGQQNSTATSPWIARDIDLRPYRGVGARLRITATLPANAMRSDMAIDKLALVDMSSIYFDLADPVASTTASIRLHPVPANDRLNVVLDAELPEDAPYTILDAAGRVMAGGILAAGRLEHGLSIAELHDGLYLLRIGGPAGARTARFVVQH
jgi:hypothetical protein